MSWLALRLAAGAHAAVPAGIDGRSFAGLLRGEAPAVDRPLFWHNPAPRPAQTADLYSSAVRLGALKLIEFPSEKCVELYALDADPAERNNLRNMFNSYLVGVGRYNAHGNGYLRVYLNEPRSFRLTLSADY
jgi:hypothetical protein